MALAYAVQGATHRAQNITWTTEGGTPVDLTGATLTGKILPKGGTARSIDGDLAIVLATAGTFTWTYGTLDVGTAGDFAVQFEADYGARSERTKASCWEVKRWIG